VRSRAQASTQGAKLECAFVGQHYLQRLWEVAILTCNAAERAKPDADPAAPPPFALPTEVYEWAGWEPSEELEAAMATIDSGAPPHRDARHCHLCTTRTALGDADARMCGCVRVCAERVISPASLPEPQLTVAYLHYAIELLLNAGLHLHALMPLTLVRLIAKRILHMPALERATALRITHVLHQLGLTDKAAAVRSALTELRPTPEARRKNAVTLRQLQSSGSDAVIASAVPTVETAEVHSALAPPSTTANRKLTCARPIEGNWVDLAELLIDEGEWAAAREWLLEAAPLLQARAEPLFESKCRRLLARLDALHGDPAGAAASQLSAMSICPLEADEWAGAVLALAQYRTDAGDERLGLSTLSAAVELAGRAAAETPSGAVDARLAQARIQQALGVAYGAAAAALSAAGMGMADEAREAGAALDAAVATFFEVGDQRKAALALVQRAKQHDALPVVSGVADGNYVLEAEAEHLSMLHELLTAAHLGAERAYFLAAPRTLPARFSLPLARELSDIKVSLATHHLRQAALNAKVAAANPTAGPSFPTVEGGDDETVRAFVAPVVVAPPPVQMEPEGRAQLHAASAIALAGGGAARARALRVNGEVLYARAAAAGWGVSPSRWELPTPADAEGAPAAAEGVLAGVLGEGEGEEGAPAEEPPPPPGLAEAEAAGGVLAEALSIALAEGDLATAEGAAMLLARACGIVEAAECAKWLCLYQACAAHRHWRAEWMSACAPSERVALRARLTQWLPQRWVTPAALPAMQAAEAALVDATSGSAAWRALAVPADPLADLWSLLPPNMRVLLLALDGDDAYATVVLCQPAELPPGGLPKGAEPPPPTLRTQVARAVGVGGAVQELLGRMESLVSAQSKAALQRTKDDLAAVEHKGTEAAAAAAVAASTASKALAEGTIPKDTCAAAIVPTTQLGEAEYSLRTLAAQMDATLGPLLEPLLPLLGADAELGGGAALSVVVIAGAALSGLPLELLTPLRRPHVTAVSRDLSAPLLAARLRRTAAAPAAAKKGTFGGAVDPRNEVTVPKPSAEQLGSRPGSKQAAKKPPPKSKKPEVEEVVTPSHGVCSAFSKDVLEGTAVPFGKEWNSAATLLGSHHVPSPAEWQRALLGCGAFVAELPGAFHEQVAPQHVAPLRLESCTACLLFDRAASDLASRRLAKEANAKTAARIALESAHAAAALLSLSGVRTVVANQWASAALSNHQMLVGVLAKMGAGTPVGEALGACARAAMAPVPEPEAAPAPADISDAAPADCAAPAPAPAEDAAAVLWTVLANPVIYGLADFKVE
jgi:hypothetical protein